jgi:hypothetical protein
MTEIKQRLLQWQEGDGLASSAGQTGELLGLFLDVVCEPVHARLLAWAALTGEGRHLKMVKNRGLEKFVDLLFGLCKAHLKQPPGRELTRDRVQDALLVAIAATHGYAMGKSVYVPALGKEEGSAVDARFRMALAAMLRSYLDGSP